ncbi:NrfD/PsrC family molybdoenzyme membrane anchor subunit [Amorphus sp. 3PC139-8]|uniref:NrfD/PsrC family molybdoenzyme membrane anchor subunit n=1 Tax=Amorphus sp. 3PC139-8 TaxID=2735676 RepID=UPI00345C77C5
MTTAADSSLHAAEPGSAPVVADRGLSRDVSDVVLERPTSRAWLIWALASLALTMVFAYAILHLFIAGVGIWGVNTSVVWGLALTNYVWWIGIGNAGTLISSMLYLTRQDWRSSINRFAEAMTLFAALIAGLFPILHLGRPWLFAWLVPYPTTMGLPPNFNSPLVWDFFAIAVYLIVSLTFWYIGAVPDFATLRDRARLRRQQVFYGILALGWRGSAGHWRRYERAYILIAALATPLVVSVHSVVGLDFAASVAPGWNEPIYPPYFVVGAMYSGFAMVVVLAAIIRSAFNLHAYITERHFDLMGKMMLFGALVLGYSYAMESFIGWYSAEDMHLSIVVYKATGDYWWVFWSLIACNVVIPQALWFPAARRRILPLVVIAILINIGMWLERYGIIVFTLSHGHMPSGRADYMPTVWDWALTIGSLGFFLLLFLVLVRLVPIVSMHEMRKLLRGRVQ